MEDKWFVFWERNALISTAAGQVFAYVVRFKNDDDSYAMFEADVNRDPEQYTETSDKRYAEMISYLVDVLLLHQRALFPSEDPSIDKRVIMEWSLVGRAMLGNIPMISELPSIALREITDPDNSIQKK